MLRREVAPAGTDVTRTWTPGVLAVIGFIAVALAVSLISSAAAGVIAPLGLVVGYGTASVVMWRRSAAMRRRERLPWRYMAGGLALVTIGIVIVGILDTVTPAGAPAIGFADAFFVGAYLLLLTGLALLPQLSGTPTRRLRLLLDGLIGGVSIGVVLWIFEIRDLIGSNPDAPLLHRIVGSAYPSIDLAALVVVMIVVVRRSEYRFDGRLMLFAAGTSLQAGADIAYLKSIGGSFGEAQPLFPMMLLAVAAFVATAAMVRKQPSIYEYADRSVSMLWMMAPYGAAAAMVGLLVIEVMKGSFSGNARLLLLGTLAVGGLVIVRQTAAIRENRLLVESQRAALVSSISHELRTPLTAMVGFLSLLDDPEVARTLPEEEKADLISTVHSQTTYLSRIVRDLVMLARGDLDQMDLSRAPTDVAGLVRASVAAVDEGRQELIVDVEDELQASVDADRMQQIMVNLLSNASRYGGDKVLVVARAEGSTLRLEVHDDGPGVPKKYELAIWERFERGPNRLNAAVPGSGIGLAVVNAIVRGHGGTVACGASELLGGARFTITIPAAVVVPELVAVTDVGSLLRSAS